MGVGEVIGEAKTAQTWSAYRQAARKLRELPECHAGGLEHRLKAAFLTSFTVEPVVDFTVVEAVASGIRLETYAGAYGLFRQEILGMTKGLEDFAPDLTILIVEFEALVSRQTGRTPDAARQAVEEMMSLVDAFTERCTGTLVLGTFVEPEQWPLHIVVDDATRTVREANQSLLQACTNNPRVQICDVAGLVAYYGRREALSPELLHMARIPFSEGFLALLARKVVSHFRAHRGALRKCLVLDCDNTLWGGIIGEDGINGIAIGPDAPGREYTDFQQAVLELHQQGVVLAINSKNNLADVVDVLRHHPHMVLREEHFATVQANWNDKPSNMRQIAEELNLGLDSFVFVDDSPTERAMMRAMLPEVYTLELPTNPSHYGRALRETGEFAKASVTDEDRMRGALYAAQRKREELRRTTVSVEDFLRSLEMVVSIRQARPSDVKRVAQLTQRTNQFNLTNRRYSEADVTGLVQKDGVRVYALGVRDRFGDNGMVGTAVVVAEDDAWRIDSLVMSCRVIGRRVEDVLVNRILKDASASGVQSVRAEYVRSSKNDLVADLWDRLQFEAIQVTHEHSVWRADVKTFRVREFEHVRCEDQSAGAGI